MLSLLMLLAWDSLQSSNFYGLRSLQLEMAIVLYFYV